MPTEGQIKGAIGALRLHQKHNTDSMAVCDAYEALRAEQQGRAAVSLGSGFGVAKEAAVRAILSLDKGDDDCTTLTLQQAAEAVRGIGEDGS